MKSILQDEDERECYLCGRNGMSDPLQRHHVFFGTADRKKSEKHGLIVLLCEWECHNGGKNSVHHNREVSDRLKAEVQQFFMDKENLTIEQFIEIFGRNYI